MFLRDNGELGMEARDTSSNKNHLVSRPASVWGKYKQEAVTNTVAVVADLVKKNIFFICKWHKSSRKESG